MWKKCKKPGILIVVIILATTWVHGQEPWYKTTTVYQIYPRSFYDSNGDGIGDIKGIISKLDYLKDLGIETIWVSPFFSSPQADFGYDISNFKAISADYGTMEDCQTLIQEVHNRGMRILLDLVMNHTSDQHPWFIESASSENNPKRNWYIWKKGKKKPTNWKSMTGGSGWNYSPKTDSWYWASFLPFQPDLNYYNPETKAEMLQTARFWLEKGVDGFRLDIFNCIYEDSLFRNNPGSLKMVPSEENTNGFFQKNLYTQNQTGSIQFARELRQVMNSYTEPKYAVGEVFGKANLIKQFCGNDSGLTSVFLFKSLHTPFKASKWGKLIQELDSNFQNPLFPTWVLSNHDKKRFISRMGNRIDKMKLIASLQLTQRGIPFLYYGEELGMKQARIPFKSSLDPIPKKYGRLANTLAKWSGESMNRDECRTPMQWDSLPNAGFTTNKSPWLPVNGDYQTINVESETLDQFSLLNQYRSLIRLRKENPILALGQIQEIKWKRKVLQITRNWKGKTIILLYNFRGKASKVKWPETGKIYSLTHHFQKERNLLRPYEAAIWKED